MEPQTISINRPLSSAFNLEHTTFKMPLNEVFASRNTMGYLNEFTLFMAHFNAIPNFIHEVEIDCRRAHPWFSGKYKSEIRETYFNRIYSKETDQVELDDIFYFLYEDLLVDFDTNNSRVRFLFKKTDQVKVEEVIKGVRHFKKRKSFLDPEIALLVNGRFGIEAKSLKITRPRLNIEDNYNDDFKEIHRMIIKRLSRKDDKGLVLLHGKPGTGKTSYIRYLIGHVKKEVIFLPPNMASAITSPDLISVLINHPHSVFVIEDAENIIMDRERNGSSPVSALLNISDGLLADCLNIQVICSFNTDLSKVDNALLRKGRLIAKYEFKELETHKANLLSEKLGYPPAFTSHTLLTNIYHQEEKDFQKAEKAVQVGFRKS